MENTALVNNLTNILNGKRPATESVCKKLQRFLGQATVQRKNSHVDGHARLTRMAVFFVHENRFIAGEARKYDEKNHYGTKKY